MKNIDFQYLQIATTIYLQILQIEISLISRYFCQANFNIFAILINILQYIDQYIGQSGVNISAILEHIDNMNILINISNNINIGKY